MDFEEQVVSAKAPNPPLPLCEVLMSSVDDLRVLHAIATGELNARTADPLVVYRLMAGGRVSDLAVHFQQFIQWRARRELTDEWVAEPPSVRYLFEQMDRWAANRHARMAQYHASSFFVRVMHLPKRTRIPKMPHCMTPFSDLDSATLADRYWRCCYNNFNYTWQLKRNAFLLICACREFDRKPGAIYLRNDVVDAELLPEATAMAPLIVECGRIFDAMRTLFAEHTITVVAANRRRHNSLLIPSELLVRIAGDAVDELPDRVLIRIRAIVWACACNNDDAANHGPGARLYLRLAPKEAPEAEAEEAQPAAKLRRVSE
jgi:hypothetical protein